MKVDPRVHHLDAHHRAQLIVAGGQVIGLVLHHDAFKHDGWFPCDPGLVQWEPHGESKPLFTLVSPAGASVTIEPHIICRSCGDKGFIRDSKWIPFDGLDSDGETMEGIGDVDIPVGVDEADPELERLLAEEDGTDDPFVGSSSVNEESLRKSLLDEALGLVTGDRNNAYGPPHQDFQRTADIWTAMFRHKLEEGRAFTAHDVAEAMIALKLSRLQWSPHRRDNWTDIAGYAACGFEAYELTQKEDRD